MLVGEGLKSLDNGPRVIQLARGRLRKHLVQHEGEMGLVHSVGKHIANQPANLDATRMGRILELLLRVGQQTMLMNAIKAVYYKRVLEKKE
jgi:hypothetical protein